LRGRIVTAVSLRECLDLPAATAPSPPLAVGIEHRGDLYGLLVDEMGEVLSPEPACREENPANLDAKWRFVSVCVYRLQHKLVLALDVDRLLDFRSANAA
jgi:purine-binding chemotaxis protein CheW